MRLEEAKELLENEGYIVESFKDDLIAAFVTQCGDAVIGNKPIWRKYYDRIMKNPEMAQYVKDAKADGMSADEIVEYLLDWDENLNEDFTMGVGAPLGADQGIPHSMQGCAVPMMRLGDPAPYGKIQKCAPPPQVRGYSSCALPSPQGLGQSRALWTPATASSLPIPCSALMQNRVNQSSQMECFLDPDF